MWILYALIAVMLLGVSPLLMKSGTKKTDPILAAAVWSIVMLIYYIIRVSQTNAAKSFASLGQRNTIFLLLAGVALGAAVIFMFMALHDGEVMKVIPILFAESFLVYILGKILERSLPSVARIIVLIILFAGVILMQSKSKGRGGNRWIGCTVGAVLCMVLCDYFYKWQVRQVNGIFGKMFLFLVATVLIWIALLVTGGYKKFRGMAFVDGVYLILSAVAIGTGWEFEARAHALSSSVYVTGIVQCSLLVTVLFGCVFLKEKMTGRALFGLILIEGSVLLWYGCIPVLSALL